MRRLGSTIRRFAREDRGATAIEYGLIAALVAVTALVGIMLLGNGVSGLFGSVADKSSTAMAGG